MTEEPLLHVGPGQSVQRAKGLVQQDDVLVGQRRPEECDPLPHTARQEMRIATFEALQPELLRQLQGAPPGLGTTHALQLQSQDCVVQHGAPGEKQVLLVHVANRAGPANRRPTVEVDAASCWLLQTGDDVQQGALAAAAGADQADELACVHPQAHVLQHWKGPSINAERLRDALQLYPGRLVGFAAGWAGCKGHLCNHRPQKKRPPVAYRRPSKS